MKTEAKHSEEAKITEIAKEQESSFEIEGVLPSVINRLGVLVQMEMIPQMTTKRILFRTLIYQMSFKKKQKKPWGKIFPKLIFTKIPLKQNN